MFFVYIIQSEVNSSFYIGYTSDLIKRIQEHNSGRSKYTSTGIPWGLVYKEEFHTKREAIIRERFLKKQRNKAFYERLINQNK